MKTRLFLMVLAALLAACGTTAKREQERLDRQARYKAESAKRSVEHKKRMQAIEDHYAIPTETPEEKAAASAKSRSTTQA